MLQERIYLRRLHLTLLGFCFFYAERMPSRDPLNQILFAPRDPAKWWKRNFWCVSSRLSSSMKSAEEGKVTRLVITVLFPPSLLLPGHLLCFWHLLPCPAAGEHRARGNPGSRRAVRACARARREGLAGPLLALAAVIGREAVSPWCFPKAALRVACCDFLPIGVSSSSLSLALGSGESGVGGGGKRWSERRRTLSFYFFKERDSGVLWAGLSDGWCVGNSLGIGMCSRAMRMDAGETAREGWSRLDLETKGIPGHSGVLGVCGCLCTIHCMCQCFTELTVCRTHPAHQITLNH